MATKIDNSTVQPVRRPSSRSISDVVDNTHVTPKSKAEIEADAKSSAEEALAREQYEQDRKHAEEREDSAYQRAVQDANKAGIHLGDVSAQPSASNTGADYDPFAQAKLELEKKQLSLNQTKQVGDFIGKILPFLLVLL